MNTVTVVMYHYIRDLSDSRYPGIKGLDYKEFQQQIEHFINHYNIISMEDVICATNGGKEDAFPKNAMLLTFDDGYKDHFEYAFPILDKFGLQGSFFAPGKTFTEYRLLDVNKVHFILASSDIDAICQRLVEEIKLLRKEEQAIESVEELWNKHAHKNRFDDEKTIFVKRVLQVGLPEAYRNQISSKLFEQFVGMNEKVFAKELYMNLDQMKCMKNNGMFFGIHGYDHYWLDRLGEDTLEKDIIKAKEVMSPLIDRDRWVMCYPYGASNRQVEMLLEREGCVLAFNTEVKTAEIGRTSRYQMPRFDTNDFYPKSENKIRE